MKIPGVDDGQGPEVTVLDPDPAAMAAPLPANVFDITAAQNSLDGFRAKVEDLNAIAVAFEVTDDVAFARLAEMAGQAKQLDKAVSRAAEGFYIDAYNYYKSVLNIKNAITNATTAIARVLKQKGNEYAYKKELDRREAEKKANAEAVKVQARLDAEAKKKGVKKVTIPAPVFNIPQKAEPVKTQSGTMSSKMVWDCELTDLTSKAVFDMVLRTSPAKYRAIAEAVLKKAIKSGIHEKVKGVRFFERAETTHRAR